MMKKSFLLILLSMSFLSCKPAVQESQLLITVGPKPANALPITLDTCKGDQDGVAKPSFELTTFNFQWAGTNPMKIAYIQLDIRSGLLEQGKYQCFIAGDELTSVLYPNSGELTGGDTVYKARCGIRCGGLVVNSNVTTAYFTGTLKIVGVEVDSDNNASQVVTETEVAVQYTKP